MFLTVVTASKSSAIGKGLTYETDNADIKAGSMVRVPLRKSIVEGIVTQVTDKKLQTEFDLRSVKDVLGDVPLLTESQMKTVHWMSEYYCCSLRHALSVWLPSPPWSKLLPPERVEYRLADHAHDFGVRKLGKKRIMVMDELSGKEWMDREALMKNTGASAAVLKRMDEIALIEKRSVRGSMQSSSVRVSVTNDVKLSTSQTDVYNDISREKRPSLLFGITGSGKTEIYATMIRDVVDAGKQAMLLVPEILLTEHVIERCEKLLPRERISVMHSRLKPGQRKNEWQRIHRGEVSLVIGSRSALFSPLRRLGLIILDEEHEWTYKNEQTPRYHARETAEAFCRFSGAKLVLGSATPSLESWARAKSGQYHLARLPERFGSGTLPDVKIIDLAEAEFGQHYPFTPQLISAIEEKLKRGEQSVLFLNRRGMASALLCLQCRRRVVSPESQLPFTVHHGRDGRPYLVDHTSGITAPVPAACPQCGSVKLHEVGAGTQRIEAILKKILPTARLLRADTDTLESPEHMRSLLQKMRGGEADILLGTQTVVKGLDLPNVTLAAVLIADIGMSLPHFRAGERIMQLLTQLTGRSGRSKPGDVIIQTFRPDAAEVIAASKHATEPYIENELKLRTHAGYPPAHSMIRLIVRGHDADKRARELRTKAMTVAMQKCPSMKISAAPTLFGGGREWQVLLRGESPREILTSLSLQDVVVDVDPIETV